VLDLGGGAGRYTLWLAQQHYRVTLLDLSPNLLDIARHKVAEAGVIEQVEAIAVADACNLSDQPDASFDAALCLGPFYHLTAAADRDRAASELARVLKPGAPVFVAFMPVYSFLRRTLGIPDERHHLADPVFVSRLMEDGVFLNDVPGRFNAGYGVRPQAIAPFMEAHGFETLELLADTGFATHQASALAELAQADPAAHQAALNLILQTAADPSLLGGSIHLLYIGHKH
jgi:SAM-dependent methyltransferase